MIKIVSRIIIFTAAGASTLSAAAGAQAFFPETSHDFKTILEEDGPASHSFAVVNTGDEPLIILSARATCGCTTPEYPREAIAPGDTAYISVAYDPEGRPGRFIKAVHVETSGSPAKVRLDISGVVVGSPETVARRYPVDFGPLKLTKSVYVLGEATMRRMKTVYLEGYNRSTDSLRIAVGNVPGYMNISIAPEVAPSGEQVTLIAYVAPGNGTPYGVVEDTLSVSPVPGQSFQLPTLMTVKEDFSKLDASQMKKAPIAIPEKERIDFGYISKKRGPVAQTFRLENAGKSDLVIRRAYSTDKGISVAAKSNTVKKGKSTDITVTVDPAACQGALLNSTVQIITNDPLHPVYTIRIVGQWDKN